MGNYVEFLTGNYILNVAFMCWFWAQFLKIVYNYVKIRKVDLRLFFSSGSMPSSHSSLVVGTTAAVANVCGMRSPEFAIALVFALIVMYDATGVRRAAGEQAKRLNYIMENWDEASPEMFEKQLKELIGHTPIEVASGALLGLLIAMVM